MVSPMNPQPCNPFWDYSVSLYDREGVATLCLQLQDDFGLDVNLVLYACWLAQRNLVLTPAHLAEVDSLTTRWRVQVVQPLRQLRQQWRAVAPAKDLRSAIKALELQAERQQQDQMYTCFSAAQALPAGAGALRSNLALVATGTALADDNLAPLLEQLALLCERVNSG